MVNWRREDLARIFSALVLPVDESERLDRGATLLHAQTGYRREETMVVLTAVSNRELPRLTAWVTQIDPEAFLIVSRVNEVHGRGFTLQRNVIIKETS